MEEQFVTFFVGDKLFAVNIFDVREVVRFEKIIPIPDAPAYVEGVANLRGIVLPVIALRKRLGFGETDLSRAKIVVVMVEDILVGMLVDQIDRVIHVSKDHIQDAAGLSLSGAAQHFVDGIIQQGEEIIYRVDIRRLFTVEMRDFLEKKIVE
ncbi:chemotaxis protein CheW [Thermospira aquatica]|uniref:Purine-binding chemotaxis protein CheW n=1 Tax=Thermospira aquatica TaxID=2828656 RepID=A0AAX3BE11_9SPIR|nr:chemotaxis protein CheW [Thermospira aquatica]URA10572.1 purine-binding chemotaxis protein CheW [Thermospira aquatica]